MSLVPVEIPDADDTAGLVAFVRERYPLDPDFGPLTKTLRTVLHRLCDRAERLEGEIESLEDRLMRA